MNGVSSELMDIFFVVAKTASNPLLLHHPSRVVPPPLGPLWGDCGTNLTPCLPPLSLDVVRCDASSRPIRPYEVVLMQSAVPRVLHMYWSSRFASCAEEPCGVLVTL